MSILPQINKSEFLESMVRNMLQSFGFEEVAVYLAKRSGPGLELSAQQVASHGGACRSGASSVSGDEVERAFSRGQAILSESKNQLCLPISEGTHPVGVLLLRKAAIASGDEEISLFQILADQIGFILSTSKRPNSGTGTRAAAHSPIIGESASLANVLGIVSKVAPTTASILIQGESGTGKELIARRIHEFSGRAGKSFIAVNCSAFQESLLESELFGHEKGAFTGAVELKRGLCELADGGTLFLDEVGELSLGMQVKLLRFLQEGEFYRVGGKNTLTVDVRVVSATNRDLELEMKAGRFREDLFYRLNTMTLRMPPLRKRVDDIEKLVMHFLRDAKVGGYRSTQIFSPEAMDALRRCPWPGNIRELQNTVERLKVLCDKPVIGLEDLPAQVRFPSAINEMRALDIEATLEEVEKVHILRTLSHYHNNKTKTAKALGITIKTLYNKLGRYGLYGEGEMQNV